MNGMSEKYGMEVKYDLWNECENEMKVEWDGMIVECDGMRQKKDSGV